MVINPYNLNNNKPTSNSEEIKKLLEENLKLTKEMHNMLKSVKSFVIWQRIFGVLKILIIVVPIVLGIIYLPPLLKNLQNYYQEVFNLGDGKSLNIFDIIKGGKVDQQDLEKIDIDKLPPELQEKLK